MSKDKGRKNANHNEKKEEKITIRHMISNVLYMLKYAAKYDKPLIIRVILLNVLLKSGMAINDTFILKKPLSGPAGSFSSDLACPAGHPGMDPSASQ